MRSKAKFFRMCTCGVEAPPIDSMVDEDGKCEYCADDASNSTRLLSNFTVSTFKIYNLLDL